MNGAMTVMASNNSVQVVSGGWGSLTGDYGSTVAGGYCYGCWHWPCTCHHHYITPIYQYTIASPDKAVILKAWLDGFMTDRKMSEKALETIREKIAEFC